MLFIKNLYQKILSSFSGYISLSFLRWTNLVSLSLLLFLSPVYGAIWLLLATLYFFFKGMYKNIFIAWGVFFITWYFFFIVLFLDFEYQIWIGGDDTLRIMIYLCDKFSIYRAPWYIKPFEDFYFQTLLLLHLLSFKLGFPIYVPSLI